MLADYTTGTKYRTLDGVVKPLFDRLEEITNKDFAFNSVKTQVHAASDALRANFNIEGVSGPDIVDKLKDYSKTYLEAAGIQLPSDELYAGYMGQMLGDNAGAARDAIEIGDIDELAKLFKDAYASYNFGAQLNPVTEKISLLDSDKKQAFGKAAAERLGAADYMKILDNIQAYIAELARIKLNPTYS